MLLGYVFFINTPCGCHRSAQNGKMPENWHFSVFLTSRNVFQNCENYINNMDFNELKSNLLHKKITGIKKMLGNKL